MSATSQPTGFTGIVNQQQKLDNSEANAPGVPNQQKFENTGATGQTQQPGYLQQAYEGVTNLVSTAASVLPGTTGATTTGTGTGIAAPKPLHPAAQRAKQQHGPTGGVGSLPGTPNEEDVVRLPEERQHPDPLSEERDRRMQAPLSSRLDDPTEKASYAAGAPAGAGTHPHTTGGSAIGSNFDHHHGLGMEHQKRAAEGAAPAGAGIGATGIHPRRDEPGFGATTTTHDSSITHPSQGIRDTSGTHGISDTARIHPRQDAPGAGATTATHDMGPTAARPREATKETTHKVTDPSHTRTTGTQDLSRDNREDLSSPSDPSHKPTMREKMKGQAKIISGKMTKDAEKVEEGRAMKSPQ